MSLNINLLTCFEAWIQEQPNKILAQVIIDNRELFQLTYQATFTRAKAFAKALLSLGCQRQDRVLIVSENHPCALVALLGCWYAGAIPVPIDASLAEAQWLKIAERVQAVALSVSPKLEAQLSDKTGEKLCVLSHHGEHEQEILLKTNSLIQRQSDPKGLAEDVVLVLMSSGSTDVPKAIMLTEQNISTGLSSLKAVLGMNNEDQIFCPLPFHHVYPLLNGALSAIANGATLTQQIKIDAISLRRSMILSQPTIVVFVGPLLDRIVRRLQQTLQEKTAMQRWVAKNICTLNLISQQYLHWNIGRYLFGKLHEAFGYQLRFITTGGSHFDADKLRLLQGVGLPVIEAYGLSETTGAIAVIQSPLGYGRQVPSRYHGIFINLPDQEGVGEVCCYGDKVMAGYLGDLDKTNAVLKDGVFYSNDLGRINHHGELVILGRKDDMIVTPGGKKVMPDEIESRYAGLSNIDEFSVFGMPVGSHNKEVHAAVVIEKNSAKSEEMKQSIRDQVAQIAQHYPVHFQIKQIHFVDELPKAGIKVKRKILPELVSHASVLTQTPETSQALPNTQLEERLLEIWRDVFRDDQFSDIQQTFTGLGGDSIMFTDLLAQTMHEFQLPDSVKSQINLLLKSHDTVEKQAIALRKFLNAYAYSADEEILREKRAWQKQENQDTFYYAPAWKRFLGGIYQFWGLLCLPVFWFGSAYPIYWVGEALLKKTGVAMLAGLAPLFYVMWFFCALLAFVLFKWLLIGRYRPGDYKQHSWYYYRWWTMNALQNMLRSNFNPLFCYFAGTRLLNYWFCLLGAKIGRDCQIDAGHLGEWDLLSVGQNSRIAAGAIVQTSLLDQGYLKLRAIQIGQNVDLGRASVVAEIESVPDNMTLRPLSHYTTHRQEAQKRAVPVEQTLSPSTCYRFAQWFSAIVWMPYALGVPVGCVVVCMHFVTMPIYLKVGFGIILGLMLYLFLCWLFKRCIIGKLKPGEYKTYGLFAFKKWFFANMIAAVTPMTHLFVSSSVYNWVLRHFGVDIAKSAASAVPNIFEHGELLHIGENTFCSRCYFQTTIASERPGYTRQSEISVEKDSFIFLQSYLMPDVSVGKNSGVSSLVYIPQGEKIPDGYERTQDGLKCLPIDPLMAARPPRKHILKMSWLRNVSVIVIIGALLLQVFASWHVREALAFLPWVLHFAAIYWAAKLCYLILLRALYVKSTVDEHRIWDREIVKRYVSAIPMTWFCSIYTWPELMATPFYNAYFRLFGMKIGKGVIINSVIMRDMDLLQVGDFSVINQNSSVIAHALAGNAHGAYINKKTRIGKACMIGAECIVFPGAKIKDHTRIYSGALPIYTTIFDDVY